MAHDISHKILVPVQNDGWAPEFQCGQFAIVDTSEREPADGSFFCIRHDDGAHRLIRIEACAFVTSRTRQWTENYGLQNKLRWDKSETDEWFYGCDGPFTDRYMRKRIVGRVIGTLGNELRFLPSSGAQ